ncbi:hypothetical protein GcM3_045028 [Golovinomyces cichoracearum]|uniref:Uncharacterized protein n=1 Tax=Golovinomyces cichoracearum TaxID=62708 RepID=A0A420J0V7_9PEZI|nr:hypothetical protein GcM3_045028 [Golovinomyces cichoracearum]
MNLRNDAFIHNKIVTACESQPAFKNVCERPAVTLYILLNDLLLTVGFHDRINNSSPAIPQGAARLSFISIPKFYSTYYKN